MIMSYKFYFLRIWGPLEVGGLGPGARAPMAPLLIRHWITVPTVGAACRAVIVGTPSEADDCSAHFCHLNHFCHSSPVLSIHINPFCQPHHFCKLLSTQSSPVFSTISTIYVATDEITTLVNKARPLLSTVIFLPIRVLCSVTI